MNPSRLPTAIRAHAFHILAALLVIAYLVVSWREAHAYLEYDEAYNLQVIESLASGNGYSTFGALQNAEAKPFDPYISTGPVMLLPGVLTWLAGGGYSWMMRLVPLGFFTLLVVCLFGFTRQFWGKWCGLAVAATPFLLIVGRQDLISIGLVPGRYIGEFAALGLLVAAAWAGANNRIGLAALLAGLSCQTKSVFVVGGALLLAVVWIHDCVQNHRPDWKGLCRGVLGAVAPTLVFEVYRLISLGSMSAYRASIDELMVFLDGQSGDPVFRPERFGVMAEILTIPGMILVVVATLFVALRILSASRIPAAAGIDEATTDQTKSGSSSGEALVDAQPAPDRALATWCWAALVGYGLFATWSWIWQATQASPRQTVPLIMLLHATCVILVFRMGWPCRWWAPVLAAIMVALAIGQGIRAVGYLGADEALDDQREAAKVILASGTGALPVYGAWFQLPEYQLLTGIHHENRPGVDAPTIDVYTDLMAASMLEEETPDAMGFLPQCRGTVLYESSTVVVCRR